MNLQEAYNELGLNYYSDKFLSLAEIEKVYKKLARQYHPDMNVNFPKHIQELSEQKFKKINEAICVIREYHQREQETIRQEELRRQEEERWQEELRKQEELRRQAEQRRQKELKRQEELRRQAEQRHKEEAERRRRTEERHREEVEKRRIEEWYRKETERKKREEQYYKKEPKEQKPKKFSLKIKIIFSVLVVLLISCLLTYKYNFGEHKVLYKNKDIETFTYVFGVKEGQAEYEYSNGDTETYFYKNGVKEGAAEYRKYEVHLHLDKSLNYKLLEYTETYTYKNGVKKGPVRRIYPNGKVEILD